MGSKPSPPPAHWRGKRKNYTTKQLQTLGTEQSLFQANCMKDVNRWCTRALGRPCPEATTQKPTSKEAWRRRQQYKIPPLHKRIIETKLLVGNTKGIPRNTRSTGVIRATT